MARRGALVLLALALVLSSACRVTTNVSLTVDDDGSGKVEVAVGVDDDALARAPELTQVRTDDLTATGWSVTGPERHPADGLTWWTAMKPFANPEEASRILDEIAGADGAFRGFEVTRERAFARTEFGVDGTVDLTRGLESFSDSALAAQLDGKPLGDDIADLERRLGQPLDDAFRLQVFVRLPGSLASNAPQQFADTALWQPHFSDAAPTTVHATSTDRRWATIIGVAVIGVAAVALVAWVVVRALRHHRRPTNAGPVSGLSSR